MYSRITLSSNPTVLDILSEVPVDRLVPVLRHKDQMVSAMPTDVGLALPVSHDSLLFVNLAVR